MKNVLTSIFMAIAVASAIGVMSLKTVQAADAGAKKKIVLVAGRPSHGPGQHEFRSGCLLLEKWLNALPNIHAEVYTNGWPTENTAFDGAAAVLLYMDGGPGHPILRDDHMKVIGDLAGKGVGIAFAHYAVEIPIDKGGAQFKDWIGGFYQDGISINPEWVADFKTIPTHPITRGVKPFSIKDEWYFNIQFRDEMKGITPLLVAKPNDEVRQGATASPRGPKPHIVAASGRDEVMMWAVERPDGGRGFGFTGGHANSNWGNEDFRKIFLNAMVWLAKEEVPANGIESKVTPEELSANLDPKGGRRGGGGQRGPAGAPGQPAQSGQAGAQGQRAQ